MRFRETLFWLVGLCVTRAVGLADGATIPPRYFASPEAAVRAASELLTNRDWAGLAGGYDLSLTPQVKPAQLLDGSFFLDAAASPSGPAAISRWRQPFAPGAKFVAAHAVGDASSLPCVWAVSAMLEIDQGGGPGQRVVWDCRMIQTKEGYRFLPPAPTEGRSVPPPVSDEPWQARGVDHILLYRPELGDRAKAEVPVGRSANIPALVQAVERLRPLAAAHPGRTQPGGKPWEPATIYFPSDEELLLSLAGDRLWRSLQLASPGILAKVRADNPSLTVDAVEYPHIEITRVAVAGSGPALYASPPVARRVSLRAPQP